MLWITYVIYISLTGPSLPVRHAKPPQRRSLLAIFAGLCDSGHLCFLSVLRVKLSNRDPGVWVTVVTRYLRQQARDVRSPLGTLVLDFCSLTWDVLSQQSLGLRTPRKEMPPCHCVLKKGDACSKGSSPSEHSYRGQVR